MSVSLLTQPDAGTVVANYRGDLAKMLEEGAEVWLIPVFLEMASLATHRYGRSSKSSVVRASSV